MEKEDCEGCYTHERYKKYSDQYNSISKDLICPCSICLVKPVCDNSCEKLIKYEGKLYNKGKRRVI